MASVRIEAWGRDDRPLLGALLGDPAMTEHTGGPETPEKLDERQGRYEQPGSRQYRIVLDTGERVGWVGYWDRLWRDEEILEIGWSVIPAFHRRGIATAATRLALGTAAAESERRFVHAFPSVENTPSNALCRTLGFELLGAYDFEHPPGSWLRCNDWRYDLRTLSPAGPRG